MEVKAQKAISGEWSGQSGRKMLEALFLEESIVKQRHNTSQAEL